MKNVTIFLISLLTLTLYACKNNSGSSTDSQSIVSHISAVDSFKINKGDLLVKAMNNGDTAAYNEVFCYYTDRNEYDHFFYYALMMANRYHYAEAYFHVYFILSNPGDGRSLKELDKDTYRMAIYHLLKSSEMGYESAKDEAKKVFEGKVIPKSTFYGCKGD